MLSRFREVLDQAITQSQTPIHRSFDDPKRRLAIGDYLSLFLLGLANPVARTLRGIVAASGLPGVREKMGVQKVSLGSFSETQHLIDPALLEALFASLAGELPDLSALPAKLRTERWMARDSSLFPALPRMAWALYGGGREGFINNGSPVRRPPLVPSASSAVRLHVSFDLLKDAPGSIQITPGKTCERATLRRETECQPGGAYIGDRYFGEHYGFFAHLSEKGCRYLIRVIDHGIEPTLEEELPVSAEDAQSGILRHAWVRLGSKKNRTRSERLRYLWLRGINGQILHLVTNLGPEEFRAADAALLYKKRWPFDRLRTCSRWSIFSAG